MLATLASGWRLSRVKLCQAWSSDSISVSLCLQNHSCLALPTPSRSCSRFPGVDITSLRSILTQLPHPLFPLGRADP